MAHFQVFPRGTQTEISDLPWKGDCSHPTPDYSARDDASLAKTPIPSEDGWR